MDDPTHPAENGHTIKLGGLRGNDPKPVRLEPDAAARAAIAAELDILGIKKLRFSGSLLPEGKTDWRLEADIGATVVQACVATLEPVTTRIDAPVLRRYLAEVPDLPEGDEIETPEHDEVEPLPAVLDLHAVMVEALALNLPLYPRADGVEVVAETYAEPGVAPLEDEDTKPFAGLAALKAKMEGGE